LPASIAAMIMILIMMPFFLFAMYEKNGQPLEKILHNIIQVKFVRPKQMKAFWASRRRNSS